MPRFVLPIVWLLISTIALADDGAKSPLMVVTRGGERIDVEIASASRDRVIVEFRSAVGISAADARRLSLDRIGQLRSDLRSIAATTYGKGNAAPAVIREYSVAYSGAAVENAAGISARIAALPYVARVLPDHFYRATDTDSNTLIRADQLTSRFSIRGEGIRVAIVDTGIDYTHPALGGGFGSGYKVAAGHDFVNNDDDPMDDAGHGTHVAGIIAADSESLRGVAPGATLLAYKALNAQGSGRESDLLAALERVVDPNGDGEVSDHADVLNLSLGGPGGVNSPLAIAATRAVEAGVIVCVAAGNAGRYGTIGSPGVAAKVITVGASDLNDRVASFSSRGPNTDTYAIKPEVLAPGVGILSTLPGGLMGEKDGTSMAAPHVAGVCALLRQLHRDWSTDDVKSSLITTAAAVRDDVMATGGGRIDALAASLTTLHITPAHVSYGLDDVSQTRWSSTQTLHLANHASSTQSFTLSASGTGAGQSLRVEPASVTLKSGESSDVNVVVEIDNSIVPSPTGGSLALAGTLSVSSGSDKLQLPWAYVKAARALVRHDSEAQTILFWSSSSNVIISSRRLDDGSIDTILPAGAYDLLLIDPTQPPGGVGLTLSDARIVMREAMQIDGQITLDISSSEAQNTLRMGGTDETGRLLADLPHMEDIYPNDSGDTRWYSTRYCVEFPQSSAIGWFQILSLTSRSLVVSSFSERFRLFAGEYYSDTQGRKKVYAQQYAPIRGLSGDVTFASVPYVAQSVEFVFPPSSLNRAFAFMHEKRLMNGGSSSGDGMTRGVAAPDGESWRGAVYVTPDVDEHHTFTLSPNSTIEPNRGPGWDGPELTGPAMRVADGRVGFWSDQTRSPMTYLADPTESVRIGDGPISITGISYADADHFTGDAVIKGPLGDRRVHSVRSTRFALYRDGTSEPLVVRDSLPFPGFTVSTNGAGLYRAEFLNSSSFAGGIPGQVRRTDWIDTTRDDRVAPTFQAMRVLNSLGRSASRVPVNDRARLLFAVSDYALDREGRVTADTLDSAATRVYYRTSAGGSWQELTIRVVANDLGSSSELGHPSMGTIFEADLGPSTVGNAEVDLKIDTYDVAGNRSQQSFAPAFIVGDYERVTPPRRRAATH